MKNKKIAKYKGALGDSIVVLTSAIPYAGGPLSSILSSYLTGTRFKKIEHTLNQLANGVKNNEVAIEEFLTGEQASELLVRTLDEIGKTANEDKINYLNNSLYNSFTKASINFESKDFFFRLLTDLSIIELFLLKILYRGLDPFCRTEYPKNEEPNTFSLGSSVASVMEYTSYVVDETHYEEGELSLEDYLQSETNEYDWDMIIGTMTILKSKGIAYLIDNLEKRTIKVAKMKKGTNLINQNVAFVNRRHDMIYVNDPQMKATSIESSKTQFGKEFFDFISQQ